MEEIKKRLKSLPLYAADYQEAEMLLLPDLIKSGETMVGAVSVCYHEERSLLMLTTKRILVVNANRTPQVMLDLPLEKITRTHPAMWYQAGNVACYIEDGQEYFSLMSTTIYVPLAAKIMELADVKRKQKEE